MQAQKVAVWFHGQGGDVTSRIDDPTLEALADGGWLVITCDFHINNWGNEDAIADLLACLALVETAWGISDVLLFAGSMGGLASLNALHRGALDGYPVRGWYGTMPVCDLGAAYDSGGTFESQIETAHGFSGSGNFADGTAGYDPASASSWPLIRYRFLASPDDTLVSKADHTDVLRSLLPGGVVENSLLETSGEHGDASHYNPTDLTDFADRCLS